MPSSFLRRYPFRGPKTGQAGGLASRLRATGGPAAFKSRPFGNATSLSLNDSEDCLQPRGEGELDDHRCSEPFLWLDPRP